MPLAGILSVNSDALSGSCCANLIVMRILAGQSAGRIGRPKPCAQ